MSATPAVVPSISSIEDAVAAVWDYVVENKVSLRDGAMGVWPSLRFSRETLGVLAMEGLAAFAQDEKHFRTQSNASSRPGVAWGAPHGRKWKEYLNSLTHPYRGADRIKPLYEFTRDDLAGFAVSFRVTAAGYLRRADWADFTLAVLDEHGKEKVSDLPDSALKQVAEAAAEAFGRQE